MEIKGTLTGLEGRHRLADVILHDVREAEDAEVSPRHRRQSLVPHDMVHDAPAVFLHGAAKPGL